MGPEILGKIYFQDLEMIRVRIDSLEMEKELLKICEGIMQVLAWYAILQDKIGMDYA